MLLHVDGKKFKIKPTGIEIGGIKARFTKAESVKDLTVKQIAAALTAGKTQLMVFPTPVGAIRKRLLPSFTA